MGFINLINSRDDASKTSLRGFVKYGERILFLRKKS